MYFQKIIFVEQIMELLWSDHKPNTKMYPVYVLLSLICIVWL